MARLLTPSHEHNDASLAGVTLSAGTTAATIATAAKRKGSYGFSCVTGSAGAGANTCYVKFGNTTAYNGSVVSFVVGTDYYLRFYVHLGALPPTTLTTVVQVIDASSGIVCGINLTTTGHLQLFDGGAAQIGADSAALAANTDYRIELHFNQGSGFGNLACDLYYTTAAQGADGASTTLVASTTIGATGNPNVAPAYIAIGPNGADNAQTWYITDIALNDSAGGSQNSYPGAGQQRRLAAVSDSSRTGFVVGGGGTTNLWDAVDNAPPAGVATGSATSTSQIKDTSSTTAQYTATLQDYLTAGLGSADTINLVQIYAAIGFAGVNTARTVTFTLSNPTQSVTGISVIPASVTAVGTYPTNWVLRAEAVTYAPTPTMGNAPTLKLARGTATTNEVDCCALTLLVESVPGVVVFIAPPPYVVGQALKRATTW